MAYNSRLKITKEDYTRLENLFNWMFTITEYNQAKRAYFEKAKKESYSKTRILFDFFFSLQNACMWRNQGKNNDYAFIRSLSNYLNDDNLESALSAILWDKIQGEILE